MWVVAGAYERCEAAGWNVLLAESHFVKSLALYIWCDTLSHLVVATVSGLRVVGAHIILCQGSCEVKSHACQGCGQTRASYNIIYITSTCRSSVSDLTSGRSDGSWS